MIGTFENGRLDAVITSPEGTLNISWDENGEVVEQEALEG